MSKHEPQEKEFSLKDYFVPLTTVKAIHFIVIIGLLVYFNSLFNGFVGDDSEMIVNNSLLHSILNIPLFFTGGTFNSNAEVLTGVYYRPVTTIIYSVLYTLFGATSFFYHLFQVCLHIANTLLLFGILSLFFKKKISLILSLVFLLHPINNETVVYIAALQDILFFFFGMLAFYCLLSNKFSEKKTISLSAFFLTLAIFSKESALLFLIIIPFYTYLFKRKLTLTFLKLNICILAVYIFFRLIIAKIGFVEDPMVPIMHASFETHFLTLPKIVTYYFQTFFFPKDLVSIQYWLVTKATFYDFYLPLAIIVTSITSAVIAGIYIKKHNSGAFKRYVFFLGWLILGLLPYLQFIRLDFTVAERWFNFALVGLLGLIGFVFNSLVIKRRLFKYAIIICYCLILLTYSIRDIVRNANWHNNLTLFSHDAQIQTNFLLENNYGFELFKVKQYGEAKIHLENSVKLAPYHSINWNNLGNVYTYYAYLTKDKLYIEKAVSAYKKAISNNKSHYPAYENLAIVYYYYADPKKTSEFVQQSLKLFPKDGTLWHVKALAEDKLGQHDSAIESARNAYFFRPDAQTRQTYADLLAGKKIEVQPSY